MRIARFATSDAQDPRFGAVIGELDENDEPGDDMAVVPLAGDPLYAGVEPVGAEIPLSEVRLLAPVLPRSKVVGLGVNYPAPGRERVDEPVIFLKPNTTVVGPGDPVFYPRQSSEVVYEGELAVVIGRICRDVPAARASDVIFGYTVANDVMARDLFKKDGSHGRAKAFDSFTPLGPWIETDVSPEALTLETRLNGDLVQEASTYDMLLSVPEIVAYVSGIMTLLPGDVILTGTPAGAGPMQVGDEVDITIGGIGTLNNKVVARD